MPDLKLFLLKPSITASMSSDMYIYTPKSPHVMHLSTIASKGHLRTAGFWDQSAPKPSVVDVNDYQPRSFISHHYSLSPSVIEANATQPDITVKP